MQDVRAEIDTKPAVFSGEVGILHSLHFSESAEKLDGSGQQFVLGFCEEICFLRSLLKLLGARLVKFFRAERLLVAALEIREVVLADTGTSHRKFLLQGGDLAGEGFALRLGVGEHHL